MFEKTSVNKFWRQHRHKLTILIVTWQNDSKKNVAPAADKQLSSLTSWCFLFYFSINLSSLGVWHSMLVAMLCKLNFIDIEIFNNTLYEWEKIVLRSCKWCFVVYFLIRTHSCLRTQKFLTKHNSQRHIYFHK